MRILIIPLLLLAVIVGCSDTDQRAAKNVELIQKYIAAVEAQDYGAMEEFLGEDYKGYGPSHTDSTDRAGAVAAWEENLDNLYESITYDRFRNFPVTIKEGNNIGDWVSNWAQLSIKYKDGRGPVTLWVNSTYQIENGKIVKSYTFYNEADVLRQLGYVFINPQDL